MPAVVKLLLMGFLLHNAHCEDFGVSLPKQMEALRGSCLTIPCSFTVRDDHKINLNNKCRAVWRNAKNSGQTIEFTRPTTGDLTQKNCTTTVHNITVKQGQEVNFRLECDNALVWQFAEKSLHVKVNEAPPTPIVAPPTVSVSEGQSVSVQCFAPVPCLSLPPTLTWSPVLGHIQETLQEKQDKTYVKVSTHNFTVSHLHHKKNITCSAVYSREDNSLSQASEQMKPFVSYQPRNTRMSSPGPVTEDSYVTLTCSSDANPAVQHYHWYKADGGTHTRIGKAAVLNIKASRETTAIFCEAENEHGTENSTVTELDVMFPAQILNFLNCTGDSSQISCVCETEGNPFPLIHWSFPGVSPNISFSSEPLSDKAVRSIITVIKPQWRDPVTLVCHSSNSVGSDRQSFDVPAFQHETIVHKQEDVLILGFIALRVVSLLVFPCAFLSIMRRLNSHRDHHQPADMVMMEQVSVSNEVQTDILEDVYVNTADFR